MNIPDILKNVQESKCLGTSERQAKLLEYLLQASKNGDASRIKEFTVAADVFGRNEDFDSSFDSIVRVEMYRLRKNLLLYNKSDLDYKIVIPRASFRVKVSLNNLKLKASKTLASGLIVPLLVVLLVVLTLHFYKTYFISQNQSKFYLSPEISIKLHPNSDEQFKHRYEDILRKLVEKITSFTFLRVSETANPEYTVDIKITSISPSPAHSFQVQLIHKSKSIIWSKTYTLNDIDDLVAQKKLTNQMFEALFTFKGMILKSWGHNSDLTKSELSKVRCYIDLQTNFTYNLTTWHPDKIDLLNCIDLQEVELNSEKSFILTLQSLIYLNSFRGYNDLKLDNSFAKAEALLDQAHLFNPLNEFQLELRLDVEIERRPTRDLDKVRALLNEFRKRHNSNFESSATLGFILGDWQAAGEIIDTLQFETESTGYHLHIFLALINKDYTTALALMKSFPETNYAIYTAMGALVYCKNNDQLNIESYKAKLKAQNIGTRKSYTDFLKSRRYAKVTEDLLLSIAKDNACGVFSD